MAFVACLCTALEVERERGEELEARLAASEMERREMQASPPEPCLGTPRLVTSLEFLGCYDCIRYTMIGTTQRVSEEFTRRANYARVKSPDFEICAKRPCLQLMSNG